MIRRIREREAADSFQRRINGLGAFAGYALRMNRNPALVLADRAAPHALKLIAFANLLFLCSFLGTLGAAVRFAGH